MSKDWSVLLLLAWVLGFVGLLVVWHNFVLCRVTGWGRDGTICAACQRWTSAYPWLPWVVLLLVLLLWWHVFYDCWPFAGD